LVEPRCKIPNDLDKDLIPDLAFIAAPRLPLDYNDHLPYIPDLVVEVQSFGQNEQLMLDKGRLYLSKGVRMVWLIYPHKHIVEVLTAKERHLLIETDTLTGGEVLPNFSVAIRELFPQRELLQSS
jgi:Uma2 family endonuclease